MKRQLGSQIKELEGKAVTQAAFSLLRQYKIDFIAVDNKAFSRTRPCSSVSVYICGV